MTILKRLLTILVAVLLVAVPATLAQGAPGGGPGKPPGAGNGNGGGGNGGGKANPGNKLGDLYADLMVIARHADGTPITATFGAETCVLPITPANTGYPVDDPGAYPYAPTMYYIPLVGQLPVVAAEEEDEDELEPCDVQAEYADLVEEVDLGRLNLGRAPERVLTKQLRDVQVFLTSGDIGLDASGRFTRSIDDVVVQTLDSPLANLAAYQSIFKTSPPGTIGTIPVSGLEVALTDWQLTAAQFAAASPKEDFVITVDTAQYLNRILGIPGDTPRATLYDADLGEEFLDYAGFSYTRSAMFPGCVQWYPIGSNELMSGSLANVALDGGELTGTGIDGYVKFAEDAHQVLVYLHALGDNVQAVDNITENGVCETP
ncbi:MAG: hypothetical protein WCA29_01575 [Jiangellales bacterium]